MADPIRRIGSSTPPGRSGHVRVALDWCFGANGSVELGVGLAIAAAPVFLAMSLLKECHRWSERALLALDETGRGGADEMHLQSALAMSLMFTRGSTDAVCAALNRSFEIAEEHGDTIDRAIRDCPHPTVASIRGVCIGGGLEVASVCEIRIASDDSRFGIPANRLGLTVDYEELAMIADLAGRRAALEIVLEWRIFGADEALRRNLVSRIVPRAELDATVADTVERIAAAAPLVNRWHKAFARRLADTAPLTEAELDVAYDCYATADYAEGTRTFAEKRRPEFTGR